MTFNHLALYLPDSPPEWEPLESSLLARFGWDKPLLTIEECNEWSRLRRAFLESRWFLVKNETRARCTRCNAVHPYLTDRCIERPFHGFDQVLLLEEQLSKQQGSVGGAAVHQEDQRLVLQQSFSIVPITEREAKLFVIRIKAKGGMKSKKGV